MIKWLLTIVLALIVFAGLKPLMQRLGIGRLPGDIRIRIGGKDYALPIASTVLLSLIAMVISRLI